MSCARHPALTIVHGRDVALAKSTLWSSTPRWLLWCFRISRIGTSTNVILLPKRAISLYWLELVGHWQVLQHRFMHTTKMIMAKMSVKMINNWCTEVISSVMYDKVCAVFALVTICCDSTVCND